MRRRPLNLRYDVDRDLVIVDGQQFSGDFFRMFGLPAGESRLVSITRSEAGSISVEDVARTSRGSGRRVGRAHAETIAEDCKPALCTGAPTAGAHLLVDREPVCLHRDVVGYETKCEYPSMHDGIEAMQALHTRLADHDFEAVAGPCPICVKRRPTA